jgi:hypothetical protein
MKRQLWVCLPALAAIFAAIILAEYAGRSLREPRYRARVRRFATPISPRHTGRSASRISQAPKSPHLQFAPLDPENRARCQGSAACARPSGSLALPLSFEPNVGQASPDIEFIGRGKGLTLFLTRDAISIAVPSGESENRIPKVVTLRTAWAGDRRKSNSHSTGHRWKRSSRGPRNGHRPRSLVPKGSSRLRALTGTATQTLISLSASSLNFAAVAEGVAASAGASMTLTVTNPATGAGALSFTSASIAGGNNGDFVLGNDTCIASNVAPGGTCTIAVTFAPECVNAPVARTATLVLNDNMPTSPQSVALTGTATGDFCFAPVPPQIVTAGQTANFPMELFSADGFTTAISLACSGALSGGACSVPTSITVGQQFTASVATAGIWRFARAALMLTAMAFAMAACGSTSSDSSSSTSDPGTSAGTYTLTVTGTATGSTTQTIALSLTVQQASASSSISVARRPFVSLRKVR